MCFREQHKAFKLQAMPRTAKSCITGQKKFVVAEDMWQYENCRLVTGEIDVTDDRQL